MQQQQQQPTPSRLRHRNQQRQEFSPGLLATTVTVSTVVLLLAVVFLGDWLRTPSLSLTSDTTVFSPSAQNGHNQATVNYSLSDNAVLTVQVLSEGGGVVRTLLQAQPEPAGRHFISWDGRTDAGEVAADGVYRLQVVAAGAMRSASQGVTFQIDTQPPMLQLANLPNGLRTSQSSLAVQGLTDPGATVFVAGDAIPLPVDSTGRFSFNRKLAEGDNLIEVNAIDAAGNATTINRQVTLVTAPPSVVLAAPLDNLWTNQVMVTVNGQAQPGVTVKVNDQPLVIDPSGAFQGQVLLQEGDNAVRIQAVDDVGNVTLLQRTVHVKTRLPSVQLNVADGASVSDSQLELSGRTEPGTTVLVDGRVLAVSPLGDFHTSLNLFEGQNTIQVEAHDQAGNATRFTRRVNFAVPAPASGLTHLLDNLALLPSLAFPVLLAVAILIALLMFRQNQVSLLLSTDQGTFIPGTPAEHRTLMISLDLNMAARVTLEVLDLQGRPRAILLNNRRRTARLHTFQWDGLDDYGNPLPAGDYTIQATAGTPPVRVTSAVQVTIKENPYAQSFWRSGVENRRARSARRDND